MKIAIRYYTQTGNTKKLAEAIAAELGVEARPVTEPLEMGCAVHGMNADELVERLNQYLATKA